MYWGENWKNSIKSIPLIAELIDFQKAFDSIDREMMWKILINCGIPEKTVTAIAAISSSSKSSVRVRESLIEAFQITTGFLQGATSAPFALDYVLKQTDPNHGIKAHLPDSHASLPELDFADGIVSFDSNETMPSAKSMKPSKSSTRRSNNWANDKQW